MVYISDPSVPLWTAVDLVRYLGAIPLHRVVQHPAPGSATVEDVVRMDTEHNRLCELIDGTLVEKTMGAFESYVGLQLATLLNEFLRLHNLGIALGADGMLQLFPTQVRIPDACFISWQRLQGSGFPDKPVPTMVPDLAAEVISRGNTDQEMNRKLKEYFDAGVRLVWYVYPTTKSVEVYTSPQLISVLHEGEVLDGGEVLPGLSIPVTKLFEIPGAKE